MAEHFSEKRLRTCAASVQPVIGEYVDRTRPVRNGRCEEILCVRNVRFWRKAGRGAEALIEALARTLYQGLRLPP